MITILTQPTNKTCIEWDNIIPTFFIEITGSINEDEYTSSSFQWCNGDVLLTDNTSSNASSSVLTFTNNLTESIGSYTCRITSGSGEVLGLTSSVATLSVQSVIFTQPVAASSYTEWDSANMFIVLTGSGQTDATYLWKLNDTDIDGGTNATLTSSVLANTPPNQYQCFIQSASLGKTSSLATISVINPVILTNPSSPGNLIEGNVFTMTATFSSSIPVSQTWTRNGVVLPGQTTSTLTSPAGAWMPDLIGDYASIGTTSSGSATTTAASPNVIPMGSVVINPLEWRGGQWYNS